MDIKTGYLDLSTCSFTFSKYILVLRKSYNDRVNLLGKQQLNIFLLKEMLLLTTKYVLKLRGILITS